MGGRLWPHPSFQELVFLGLRDRLASGSRGSRHCLPLPAHTPPTSRSTRTPGCLLTPPSGGADPRELVEPRDGGDDGWLGLAIGVVEVIPFTKGASHISEMVFIIVSTEIKLLKISLYFSFSLYCQNSVYGDLLNRYN